TLRKALISERSKSNKVRQKAAVPRTAALLTKEDRRDLASKRLPIKRKNSVTKIKYIAGVLIALAGLGLQQAKADTFTSFVDVPNDNLSGFTGPYDEVIINR